MDTARQCVEPEPVSKSEVIELDPHSALPEQITLIEALGLSAQAASLAGLWR